MAVPKTNIFDSVTVQTVGQLKFNSIECNTETRTKDDGEGEEYRWVISVDTETTWGGLRSCTIKPTGNQTQLLTGTMRGSPDFTLRLLDGEAAFGDPMTFTNGGFWRVTRESIVGLNADGSDQVALQQTWIGVSEWKDAWWDED